METIHIPSDGIDPKILNDVYEAAEDTFLLLDGLDQDLNYLKEHVDFCLEIGSGSGVVSVALANALSNKPRYFVATDINPNACKLTQICSSKNNKQQKINVINSNFAEPLLDRFAGFVDILIFNPPYVPTTYQEYTSGDRNITKSWAGGRNGLETTNIFVYQYIPKLLKHPNGVAYLVAIEQNNITHLTNCLSDKFGINGVVVQKRKAGQESLHIIKYSFRRE